MAGRLSGQTGLQIGIGLALVTIGLVLMNQQQTRAKRRRPLRDYSGRSGLPLGVEASRGIASDAPVPPDMLTPVLLRPYTASA